MAANRPVAVDLFCGCGGCTVGLKKAGFRVAAAVDIDPASIATYEANHPEVAMFKRDIRELDPLEVVGGAGYRRERLDLLAGCPPCQGFSTMRTLNGALTVDDPRNDLLLDFRRFVVALRPRAVMLENVPGLADDVRFSSFCSRMEELGYLGRHRILDAADYGVPQRRRRLIYVAGLGFEIPDPAEVQTQQTVRDAIGGLPKAGASGDPVHDMPERRTPRIRDMISRIPRNGGSRKDLPTELQLECHRRCNGFKDVYGRMSWDRPAPTITSGCFNPSKGRFLHPEEDRAVTMREASLLQGFPPDYAFASESKIAVALMIGNALPPPFIEAHARCIAEAMRAGGAEAEFSRTR
ncbi:MAG: DNA cytosine methyltransferase [Thermoleophilia bacterium]